MLGKALHRFGPYQCDHDRVLTQTYNNCDESHNGGKVMSALFFHCNC